MASFSEEEIYERLTFDEAVDSLVAFLNNPIAKRKNPGNVNKYLADYVDTFDGGYTDKETKERLFRLTIEVSTLITDHMLDGDFVWSNPIDLTYCCLKILSEFVDKLPNPNYSRHIEQLKEIAEQ